MINRYVKSLLSVAFLAIILNVEVQSTSRFLFEEGLKSARRVGRCLPSVGSESYKKLICMDMYCFDTNNKTIKAIMKAAPLPKAVDLSANFLPPFDQSDLGSCTANARVGAFCYAQKESDQPVEMMSRLYLYWKERYLRGTVQSDSGAALSDGILALQKFGVCKESTWPYQVDTFKRKPSTKMNNEAKKYKDLDSNQTGTVTQDLDVMKAILSSGTPFSGGFRIFDSFLMDNVTNTGIVPMPSSSEQLVGGHAVVFTGYDDEKNGGSFLARNSWGVNWGVKPNNQSQYRGYFWMPYSYLLDPKLSMDFWTISKVSMPK